MTCSVAGIATESLQLRCQNFQKKLVGSRENPRKRPREEASHESSVGCTPNVSDSKKYDEKETTLMDMVSIIKYCLVYPKNMEYTQCFLGMRVLMQRKVG